MDLARRVRGLVVLGGRGRRRLSEQENEFWDENFYPEYVKTP